MWISHLNSLTRIDVDRNFNRPTGWQPEIFIDPIRNISKHNISHYQPSEQTKQQLLTDELNFCSFHFQIYVRMWEFLCGTNTLHFISRYTVLECSCVCVCVVLRKILWITAVNNNVGHVTISVKLVIKLNTHLYRIYFGILCGLLLLLCIGWSTYKVCFI